MDLSPNIDLANADTAAVALDIRAANERLAGTAELVTVCSHLGTSWFRQSYASISPSTRIAVLRELLLDAHLPEDVVQGIVDAFVRKHSLDTRNSEEEAKFTRFADLPAELRIRIWEAATPSRTLVDPKASTVRGSGKVSLNRYLSVPRLAQVCQEARDVVFRQSNRKSTTSCGFDKFNDLVLWSDILDLRNSEMCSVFEQPSPYLTIFPLFRSLAFNLNGLSWELRSITLSDLEKLPSLTVVTQTIVMYLPSHRSKELLGSKSLHDRSDTKWPRGIRELDPEDIPYWHTWRATEQFPTVSEKHITKIIHLEDTNTLQETLYLGERWTCGHARYEAVCRQATVFCMDCRKSWWEKRDKGIAEYRLLSGLFDDESPDINKEDIFPGRWTYDLNKTHEWSLRTLGRLPELKPAVRILIAFDNFFPDFDYWENLRQRYA